VNKIALSVASAAASLLLPHLGFDDDNVTTLLPVAIRAMLCFLL
jgi:hypothetical protein